MKVLVRRALCAVAGLLAFAGTAAVAAPVTMAYAPLDAPAPLRGGSTVMGGSVASDFTAADVSTSASLITGLDLELGYKVDLSGRIAAVDMSSSHAFDGLFLSSASAGSPYVAVSGGGSYVGASAALTRNLRVFAGLTNAGIATTAPSDAYAALLRLGGTPAPYAQRSADALLAGISWQPSDWASLGVVASNTDERNGILANAAPGANTSTTALGVAARVRLGGGWTTTASYSEGVSQIDLHTGLNAAALQGDGLRTRSYGIAIAKNGLFGNDSLGIAVSQPALSANGQFVTTPGAGGTSLLTRNFQLEGIGPKQETDVEIGYITTFLDGSLALQTNASFQMNYAGQTGQNAVSLLSRARIKF
jgi:hypothetical protein